MWGCIEDEVWNRWVEAAYFTCIALVPCGDGFEFELRVGIDGLEVRTSAALLSFMVGEIKCGSDMVNLHTWDVLRSFDAGYELFIQS
jgi:hypothetical protein